MMIHVDDDDNSNDDDDQDVIGTECLSTTIAEQSDVLDAQKLFATKHRSISRRVVQSHDASNCGLDEGKYSHCR